VGLMTAFFTTRPGRPSDRPFILESWQSSHSLTTLGREMGPRYISEMKGMINDILDRPSTKIRTAVLPEDDDAILGYAVVGHLETLTPRVYFVYVKQEARKLGIAKDLLGDLRDRQTIYTHKPNRTLAMMLPKPDLWTFSFFRNWES